MRPRCGHEPATGLYYEVLGEWGGGRRPLLWIHGGGATGACWRATPDGRVGWADLAAGRGLECWVTDWPGIGRSGKRDATEIDYGAVVDGYQRLLREVIGEPVVVICHSMGGAVTWQLVQAGGELVEGVVSVAGAYPANTPPRSEVATDDGRVVEVVFGDTGVRFRVDRQAPYHYEDAYIYEQAIATSIRFPTGAVQAMRAGLVGLPPQMILQRMGVEPGMPVVESPDAFAGKPIRLVAGGEDPAHTREIEDRTLELLRSWAADAELVWLPDLGIDGNGHFMFMESNSDELFELVLEQVRAVGG